MGMSNSSCSQVRGTTMEPSPYRVLAVSVVAAGSFIAGALVLGAWIMGAPRHDWPLSIA